MDIRTAVLHLRAVTLSGDTALDDRLRRAAQ
jgi:hypothetical protein